VLALTVLATDNDATVLTSTPSLLVLTESPSAPVTTLALMATVTVGVPLIVQTIFSPAGSNATGEAGEQVLINPGGKSVTVQKALAASIVLTLVHVTVWFGGYGTSLTAGGNGVFGFTCISGFATVDVTVPVQCAAAGHVGSPPPLTVAEFTAGFPAAAAPTETGTVITIGPLVFAATIQPARVEPVAGHKLIVPPVAVGTALSVMPAGITSVNVIGAVVGPLAIAIVIV
jgi:hypothetical protein